MSDNNWTTKWTVTGTSGKEYVVARKADGSFGCSCPAWKFQKQIRKDCQHILQLKLKLLNEGSGGDVKLKEITKEEDLPKRRIRV